MIISIYNVHHNSDGGTDCWSDHRVNSYRERCLVLAKTITDSTALIGHLQRTGTHGVHTKMTPLHLMVWARKASLRATRVGMRNQLCWLGNLLEQAW